MSQSEEKWDMTVCELSGTVLHMLSLAWSVVKNHT